MAPINPGWNRVRPRMSLPAKMLMTGTVIGLFFGLCVGHKSNQPYKDESASAAVPTATVTVTATATKTVTQPSIPKSCADALGEMISIQETMGWYLDSAGVQTDIINGVYTAILAKDQKKLIDYGNKQNDLVRKTATERRELMDQMSQMKKDLQQCRADLGDDHGPIPGR